MKCCAICGAQAKNEYTAYIDDAKRKGLGERLPSKDFLTGKAQVLTAEKGKRHVFAEYLVPICAKCTYLPLIRFNIVAAVFSAIAGVALLVFVSAKAWGIAAFALFISNAVFGALRFMQYMQDRPAADYAISELADSGVKGSSSQGVWYSAEKLQSVLGSLGTFTHEKLPGYVRPYSESDGPIDDERRCRVCGRSDLKLYYADHVDHENDAVSLSCARCGGVICTDCRGGLKKFTQNSRDGQICPVCHLYTVFEYSGKKETGDLLEQAEIRYEQIKKHHP